MPMLVQITIFIAAALILVPFGKRIGIPTVLGYLFTGILLGPSVFNIANDPDEIMKLAEYGVIMLMFLIGLELRPQRLWQMRQSIFVLGGLQMAVTGGVLMLLLWLFLPFSFSASFVVGFALALSSTAFVLQLLRDRQQLKSFYGQQSFAILLFQDIAAMVLLALIPLLAGHQGAHHGIAYFAAVIATFSGLFLFSRYILRPLFRFVAKSGATELLTAVGLFIVLAVVVLMDAIGISTTLGAFLTGVLLADSEFRHELEGSIQPFKGLLLGLFFMTVGMGISLNIIIEQPLLIIAGTFALILIKLVCVTLIAYFRQHRLANSFRLGVALAQGGEFAFVVFSVAASEKMISAAMLAPLTLIVTFSMMLTPALFAILDRWIEPIFAKHEHSKQYDEIPQHENHIVVAGFGRFGQIVSRIAHLHHVRFTAIDNNIDNIDFVRKYGGKVYYGDATVPEILHSAGLSSARLLVLAIDDVEDSMNIARHVRLYHPELPILARARDRHHVYLLRELGVTHIWRETYLSALAMGEQMLLSLGTDPQLAKKHIQQFFEYDEQLLQRQQGIYADPQKLLESNRDMLHELENLFENDEFVQEKNLAEETFSGNPDQPKTSDPSA
ncbi:MAG: monovalent cation:proton antiporter-2 (CPA2) family protein [Acinetobacter populi]|uniref:monovalent cation:proton antiporter-2 (CPA2) family protein n=1 Tax=Acinetobacter populi TaxID=1582270 RepID=UPI002353F930|nr:monovalent cation:proton antiporter-2 (CPA2) family protein [Acinetobacter populi]MCH4248712.1 monovalent cation:proton antiporter-2 (CPA2) family protein [Acinetobacter populi]